MKISQAEARRLRKRVRQLKDERREMFKRWGEDWPGTHICQLQLTKEGYHHAAIATARRLDRAVVVTVDTNGLAQFYATKDSA